MGLERFKELANLEEEYTLLCQQLKDIETEFLSIDKQKTSELSKCVIVDFIKFFKESEFIVNGSPDLETLGLRDEKISATYKELNAELKFGHNIHSVNFTFRYPPYNVNSYEVILSPINTGLSEYDKAHNSYSVSKTIKREKQVEDIKIELSEKKERLKTYADEKWLLYVICKETNNLHHRKAFDSMYDLLSIVIGK